MKNKLPSNSAENKQTENEQSQQCGITFVLDSSNKPPISESTNQNNR